MAPTIPANSPIQLAPATQVLPATPLRAPNAPQPAAAAAAARPGADEPENGAATADAEAFPDEATFTGVSGEASTESNQVPEAFFNYAQQEKWDSFTPSF
eukprot:GABV01009915.1.p2 GENE.GABV01009915.1~~GABV01009915.1.p2  ORF type:complete len:100 (-),score=36.94 GABV01009915.1:145-444(-)